MNKKQKVNRRCIMRALSLLLAAILLVGMVPAVPAKAAQRDQVEAFVERLYSILLGRTVDAEGLQYWTDVLVSGADTGANVAAGIVFSEELINRNLSNEEFINCMYLTVFNREPDASGKEYWLGILTGGETRTGVGLNLLNSPEFGQICEQYGITQGTAVAPGGTPDSGSGSTGTTTTEMVQNFVKRLYSILLGREVDVTGLDYWTEVLVNQWDTGARVAGNIVFGEELRNRNLTNEEYVVCLYKTVFDREPEADGKAYWVSVLDGGEPRNNVGASLLNSEEFGGVCRSYNITQGKIDVVPGVTEEEPEVTPVPTPDVTPVPGENLPAFEKYGVKGTFVEPGVEYKYVTCTDNDTSKQTIGDFKITDYRTFVSDETHEEKEGYEWKVVSYQIIFYDDNAQEDGMSVVTFVESYYDTIGLEDIQTTEEYTVYYNTWNEKEYGIYLMNETGNFSSWTGGIIGYCHTCEFLVPTDYDGVLLGLLDGAVTWKDDQYIYDVADESTLFFRLDDRQMPEQQIPEANMSQEEIEQNWEYGFVGDGVVITKYIGDYNNDVIDALVPNVIEGKPVIAVGKYAFASEDVLNIYVPEGVKYLMKGALCIDPGEEFMGINVGSIEINKPGTEGSHFKRINPPSTITLPESLTYIHKSAMAKYGEAWIGKDGELHEFFANYALMNVKPGSYAETYAIENNLAYKTYTLDMVRSAEMTYGNYKYVVVGNREIEIVDYTGNETVVVIPSQIDGKPVTSIWHAAFSSGSNLKQDANHNISSIIIPETVTNIGMCAFWGCTELSSIIIPEGTTSIGEEAFQYCSSLSSITIPDSVTEIGKNVFADCKNVTAYITSGSYAETYMIENSIPYSSR